MLQCNNKTKSHRYIACMYIIHIAIFTASTMLNVTHSLLSFTIERDVIYNERQNNHTKMS